MPNFVTARHKGVLGRISVPEQTLKYMPGWEAVKDGASKPKRRTSRSQSSRKRQAAAPAEVTNTQSSTSLKETHNG